MDDKLKKFRNGRRQAGTVQAEQAEQAKINDCWAAMIEFLLSQKSWWVNLCAELDLTPMQGHAIRTLDPDRPLAMSTLAESLACDASNVTGIVDKLESRGLITRQGAEGDRRIKMLCVTDKGRKLRDELWARAMEAPRAVTALPDETRRRIAEVLRAIVDERLAEASGAR
jgi:DNA-binding MarR family transcriptional regulator